MRAFAWFDNLVSEEKSEEVTRACLGGLGAVVIGSVGAVVVGEMEGEAGKSEVILGNL